MKVNIDKVRQSAMDAPIPGENYTSNTKNYPWHRPPDTETYDDAIDKVIENLTAPQPTISLFQRADAGVTVSEMAATFCMQGVGRGLWTVDMALLIAGPVARIIEIILKSGGAEYELGLPNKYGEPMGEFIEATVEPAAEDTELPLGLDIGITAPEDLEIQEEGGFLGMADDLGIEGQTDDIIEEETV